YYNSISAYIRSRPSAEHTFAATANRCTAMVVLLTHVSGSQHRSAVFAALLFYYSWNVKAIMLEHSSCKRKPLPPKYQQTFTFLIWYYSCNISALTLMLSCWNIDAITIQP